MMPMLATNVGVITGGIDGELPSHPVVHTKLDSFEEKKREVKTPLLAKQAPEEASVLAEPDSSPLATTNEAQIYHKESAVTKPTIPAAAQVNNVSNH